MDIDIGDINIDYTDTDDTDIDYRYTLCVSPVSTPWLRGCACSPAAHMCELQLLHCWQGLEEGKRNQKQNPLLARGPRAGSSSVNSAAKAAAHCPHHSNEQRLCSEGATWAASHSPGHRWGH